jgi:UDPglucose 6-dehydrogenase
LAVWGLTFKPKTDDMREAPSLSILPILMENGIRIRAHDPLGIENARQLLPEVAFFEDPYEACKGADGVCVMTEWEDYQKLDLARVKSLLRTPLVIDLRNAYSSSTMKEEGFQYISLGRRTVSLDEKSRVVSLKRSRSR